MRERGVKGGGGVGRGGVRRERRGRNGKEKWRRTGKWEGVG